MEEQSYARHAKLVTPFHRVLFPLLIAIFIGSLVNVYESLGDPSRIYSASLVAAMAVALIMTTLFARIFALGVQDRVIRVEENLRHQMLAGKPLDPRLTGKQIVGLRFASDAEFVALAEKAAAEGMSLDDIKKSVKNWRADHARI